MKHLTWFITKNLDFIICYIQRMLTIRRHILFVWQYQSHRLDHLGNSHRRKADFFCMQTAIGHGHREQDTVAL